MAELETAFSTALTTVQGDVLGFIATALPVALAIGGAILAVKFGWRFFKGMGK